MKNLITPSGGISRIPAVWAEGSLRTDGAFPYFGLWLFTGEQGSGKTLLAMHCVREMLLQYPRATLISNISIYGIPSIPYRGIDDFSINYGADGSIFLIDEIQALYSSLESAKMPPTTLQVWAQNRKNRRVILGTSQRFNRVAKGIREQSYAIYDCCRPIGGIIYSYRIFDGADFDDSGKYLGEKSPHRYFYIPYISTMRSYNSLEVVRRPGSGAADKENQERN